MRQNPEQPAAEAVIEKLGLQPHPEGGWYRETWRAEAAPGARAGGTSILFLLKAGERSHWHKVDAVELWIFQGGEPLTLRIGAETEVRLGGDVVAGDAPQAVVPAHAWQAAEGPAQGWSLVACVVVPGFEFAGFELAPPGWAPAP
jgi:hypothetical protein